MRAASLSWSKVMTSPSLGFPERTGRKILRTKVGVLAGIGVGVLFGVAGLFFSGDEGGVGADGGSSLLSRWSLSFFMMSTLSGLV